MRYRAVPAAKVSATRSINIRARVDMSISSGKLGGCAAGGSKDKAVVAVGGDPDARFLPAQLRLGGSSPPNERRGPQVVSERVTEGLDYRADDWAYLEPVRAGHRTELPSREPR